MGAGWGSIRDVVDRLAEGFNRVAGPSIGEGSSPGEDSRTSGRGDRPGAIAGFGRAVEGMLRISIGASSESSPGIDSGAGLEGCAVVEGRAEGVVIPGKARTARAPGEDTIGRGGVLEDAVGLATTGISAGGVSSGPSPSPANARTASISTMAKERLVNLRCRQEPFVPSRPEARCRGAGLWSTIRLMDLSSIGPFRDDDLRLDWIEIGISDRSRSVDSLGSRVMLMKIAGEVAIVTGASSGLGAEIARQLARERLKVGLTARRAEELEQLARSIRSEGGTAAIAVADASDPDAIRTAFAELTSKLGAVDLLVANAGVGIATSALNFSGEAFDRMLRVNLSSVGYAIEAVLPSMIERRHGQIVGISSLAAFRGYPGSAGYCATKAGLSALLEGLRPELRRLGIAVTTVHPGYVRTPMTATQSHIQPLIMDVEPAVRIILKGVAARRSKVDFPKRMAALLKLVRLLPDPVYDRLAARLVLGPKQS